MFIYFYCIYFSEILALMRYSSIRVEIKFTTTTTSLAFKHCAREYVAFYTKQDFLFHIDTTLVVEVLPYRKSLNTYEYLK